MKKINRTVKYIFSIFFFAFIVACNDEDKEGLKTDFAIIESLHSELQDENLIIPFRNPNDNFIQNITLKFGGSAKEGEDFELVGITQTGVELKIIDDNEFESLENIMLIINSNGNNVHNVTITSDCADTESPFLKYFIGEWDATEKYGDNPADWYGPYHVEIKQDQSDPSKFYVENFYDADRTALLIINNEDGTVYFPDQQPLPDPGTPTLLTGSTGTFVIDECEGATTLTITLNYDGGEWVYSLVKL